MKDHTEEIERYLEEEMALPERLAFERRLAEDADLAEEFALQQKIHRALRDQESIAFRQKLQVIRGQRAAASSQEVSLLKLKPLLALLILLASVFFFWWLVRPEPPAPRPQLPLEQIKPELQNGPSPPAPTQPQAKTDTSPDSEQPRAQPVPSKKVLAFVEKQYQEYLSSKVSKEIFRSGSDVQIDSVGKAFRQSDYPAVLRIAKAYPQDAPSYNRVIWAAANAAFLSNDCQFALLYGGKISELKSSKTKAQDAEMLLLLTYLKCGLTGDLQYKALLKKCADENSHPAHQLAKEIKRL